MSGYGHTASVLAILEAWKIEAFNEIRDDMHNGDTPCELPDDDGPCYTHGTVLCHQAPLLPTPNTDPEQGELIS